jgi:hypothetical protein
MFDFMDKKSEKLASAIYLVTGFFQDQEPLKWKLRSLASDFCSLSLVPNGGAQLAYEAKNVMLKIAGLFSVATNAGLISNENNNLMQIEFTNYISRLEHSIDVSGLLNTPSSKSDFTKLQPELIKRQSEIAQLESDLDIKDKPLKDFGAVSVKKNSRQNIIITLLKRKKEVMIKDISSLINGCSEKTIQRELLSMVQTGLLKKVGEKRWSRYSLI